MGLISEEVEVKLNPRNIKWYEDLGYEIPRYKDKSGKLIISMGTKIKVNILDLTSRSISYVDIQCDNCEKYLSVKWQNYKNNIHEDGRYYCKKCATNLFSVKTRTSNKLINGKSFEQWCINNNRLDILNRWDYELNDCKPSEITFSNGKKYYFKCPRELHKSELKRISGFISGQEGTMDCKKCISFAQWGIDHLGEDFLEKYWDYEKNIIDPWDVSYGSSTKKVYIKCQEKEYHGSYNIKCKDFTINMRCGYCHGKLVHPLDSLGKILEDKELLHLWSDKNKKSPYKYTPKSEQKVYWKCPEGIHEDYPRNIKNSNKCNFRCPECDYSKGEEAISNYFISKGLIKIIDEDYKIIDDSFKDKCQYYIPQKKFKGLVGTGNGLLSYDFYLPNKQYNLLIEYDGEFHYQVIKLYKNEPIKYAEERLRKQQEHDRLKDEYAENNNINLLRIPYWEFDNIENILEDYLNNINNSSAKKVI